MKKANLLGQRFGHWLVVADTDQKPSAWQCRCDCGAFSVIPARHLVSNASRSCGCAKRTQGGLSATRECAIWAKMIGRCTNPCTRNYRFYGGVGTFVCKRWMGSFAAFLEDMGQAPDCLHSIDRIDTNGHYTCGKCDECNLRRQPANCRWASKADQARNQKSNRYYTHDGQTLILKDWARLTGIKYLTLWNRLNIGMAFADAISLDLYDRKAIKRSKEASLLAQQIHRE